MRGRCGRCLILFSSAKTRGGKRRQRRDAEYAEIRRAEIQDRFATQMLPFKVVYHDKYDLNLGPHVFPSQKFRLIAEALVAEKIASREDFVQPKPASDEDILRVHTPEWVRKLKTGTLTASDVMLLEIPYSRERGDAAWGGGGGAGGG